MGRVIDYKIDENKLFSYAKSAFKQNNYLLCVQNINEALALYGISPEMRSAFYELLILVYENTDNAAAKTDILIKNAPEAVGDFAQIDFKEFVTEYVFGDIEPEEEYGEIYAYSQIKNFIINRDYTKAFTKLLASEFSQKYLQKLADYICLAYDEDKNFNINDYFVPAISLLAKLDDKTKLINVMLASDGACRDLAVDGASVFADDADDLVKLLSLAEAYYLNGEMDVAKSLYKKALSYSPYNEDALFHLSAILYAKGDVAEGDKVFAKYKVMFNSTFLPIDMYQKYVDSGYVKTNPVLYPYLDASFADEMAREIIEKVQLDGLDGATLKEISQAISICQTEEDCLMLPLIFSFIKKDKLQAVILFLLPNPSINNAIKCKLLSKLFDIGYQGRYIAYYNSKLVFSSMVALDGDYAQYYKDLYRKLVLEMPFGTMGVPLKCNVLKNVIAKVESVIKSVDKADERYVAYLTLKNYAKAGKMLVDWEQLEDILNIDRTYFPTFLEKHQLNKWILK